MMSTTVLWEGKCQEGVAGWLTSDLDKEKKLILSAQNKKKQKVYLASVSTYGLLWVILDSVQHWLNSNVIRGLKLRQRKKMWRKKEQDKEKWTDRW